VNPRHLSLRTKFFLLVAVGSIVTATTAYVLHFRFLENLELQTIDLRFSLRGDQPSPKDVVIVRVDDVTFNELNEQWPFPRSMHGALLDQIRKGKPAGIAFDVQFTEPTEPEEDNALIESVGRLPKRIVLATTEVDEDGSSKVLGGDELLREIGHAQAMRTSRPTRTASSATSRTTSRG
jgi:CHASE2 domain-containing sensor protein